MIEKTQKEVQWLLKEKYGGAEPPAFFDDVRRFNDGEPLDYVIGLVEFLGCRIDLSRRPFIPRPETEFWVKQAIEDLKNHSNVLKNIRMDRVRKSIRCLDIFSGSGCIGVAVLKYIPHAYVDFAEKESAFLDQIAINTKLNSIGRSRYRVIRSDVFSNVLDSYDYIFANPPYLVASREGKVQTSVLAWEPRGALFGGKDGLRYIKIFLKNATRHLAPHGKLYFEFDTPQKKMIERIVAASEYRRSKFYKDQYSVWRYAVCEPHH